MWTYETGMVFFIAMTVLSLCFSSGCFYYCWHVQADEGERVPVWMKKEPLVFVLGPCRPKQSDPMLCGLPGAILILCGLATLAAWCSEAALIQSHEYFGPMQLTHTHTVSPFGTEKFGYEYNCFDDVCETAYYESVSAKIEVGWGGDWGK